MKITYFLSGLVVGVVITVVSTVLAMRSVMIVEYDSTKNFADTVSAIEESIKSNGWSSPGTMDIKKAINKKGVAFAPKVKAIKLCKPQYAAEVLTDERHVASLMPCTIAVYEDDSGKVKISKMNTGLMGKIFGGSIARVMGGKVAVDESKIIAPVLKK